MKRFTLATIMTLVGTTVFAGDGAARGYAAGSDSREFAINYWMGKYHVSREVAEYKEDFKVSIEEAQKAIDNRQAREFVNSVNELNQTRDDMIKVMRIALKGLDEQIVSLNQFVENKLKFPDAKLKQDIVKNMDDHIKMANQAAIWSGKGDKQILNLTRQIKARAERIKELCKKV